MAQETILNVCVEFEDGLGGNQDPDYEPGIDVHGNPVVPADLSEPIEALKYPFRIPIEVDLIRLINLELDSHFEIDKNVTNIDIFEDGHVEYNGQDITNHVNYSCNERTLDDEEEEEVKELLDSVDAPEVSSETSEPGSDAHHGHSDKNDLPSGDIIEGEAE